MPGMSTATLTPLGKDHVSLQIDDESENNDHSNKLRQILNDTGKLAIGIIAIEVWTLSPDRTKLIMPGGGFWVDPVYINTSYSNALAQLIDPSRMDHIPAVPLSPGEGLAGVLWSDFGPNSNFISKTINQVISHSQGITFRDVNLLAIDPDQPPNPRVRALSRAGFRLAAGLPFHKNTLSGIVVFMTRKSSQLLDGEFLHCVTDFIGSTICYQEQIQRMTDERNGHLRKIMRRVRLKLQVLTEFKTMYQKRSSVLSNCEQKIQSSFSFREISKIFYSRGQKIKLHFLTWVKKLRGANMIPPPPLPIQNVPFALVSTFLQMAIFSLCSVFLESRTNGKYMFGMGTISSFTCMQYMLTSSPAAQPSTALLSTFMSSFIALGIKKITFWQEWIRLAVVGTVSIIMMGVTGCVHPPAAGTAIAFSMDGMYWSDVCILLLVYAIAISLSVAINNMSEVRQYPIFWGNYWLRRAFTCHN